ncbi:hypothetical protein [Planosporangium thailandense]|nr:hypothetical protein [Planosporangium thailandense]
MKRGLRSEPCGPTITMTGAGVLIGNLDEATGLTGVHLQEATS